MHSILIMSFLLIFLEIIIPSDLDQDNLINNHRFPPIPIHHYDPVLSVIEKTYIFSGVLPPSYGFIRTSKYFKQGLIHISEKDNKFFAEHTQKLINNFIAKYSINDKQTNYATQISLTSGIDYLYREPHIVNGEDSIFYGRFRDVDFINKYDNKWNILDLTFQATYKDHFLFSYRIGLKEYWKVLRKRTHGIPHNLLEMNNNFNQESIFIAQYPKLLLFAGKTRLSAGLGENGKLLLSENSPPLDAFGFAINQNGKVSLHSLIAVIDNITEEHLKEIIPPKYLFIHRIELNPIKRFRVAITELMLINSYMKWQFMNPIKIYHNVTNFSSTNIISAIDAEILIKNNIILYTTFAIDELDFNLVEQNFDDKDKLSLAYQLGIKYYNLFNIQNTKLVIEWVKLDKWFYNHYAGYLGSSRDLTITYNESVPFPNGVESFTRYLGSPLGGNAQSIYLNYHFNSFDLQYQYIDKGIPVIFQPPFQFTPENDLSEIHEFSYSAGFRYSNYSFDKHFDLQLSVYFIKVKNYHNIEGYDHSFPELNIKFKYYFTKWKDSL